MPIELRHRCDACEAQGRITLADPLPAEIPCAACGAGRTLHPEGLPSDKLESCVWCGTADMYVQKDFPQGLGLGILVAGFALSSLFWLWYMPIAAFGVLVVSVLVDAVLFALVPDVIICYRCLGQYRGPGTNPEGRHHPFDLEVGERYRQERIRIEELRRRRGASSPPG